MTKKLQIKLAAQCGGNKRMTYVAIDCFISFGEIEKQVAGLCIGDKHDKDKIFFDYQVGDTIKIHRPGHKTTAEFPSDTKRWTIDDYNARIVEPKKIDDDEVDYPLCELIGREEVKSEKDLPLAVESMLEDVLTDFINKREIDGKTSKDIMVWYKAANPETIRIVSELVHRHSSQQQQGESVTQSSAGMFARDEAPAPYSSQQLPTKILEVQRVTKLGMLDKVIKATKEHPQPRALLLSAGFTESNLRFLPRWNSDGYKMLEEKASDICNMVKRQDDPVRVDSLCQLCKQDEGEELAKFLELPAEQQTQESISKSIRHAHKVYYGLQHHQERLSLFRDPARNDTSTDITALGKKLLSTIIADVDASDIENILNEYRGLRNKSFVRDTHSLFIITDADGNNALHLAVKCKRLDIVRTLLEKGELSHELACPRGTTIEKYPGYDLLDDDEIKTVISAFTAALPKDARGSGPLITPAGCERIMLSRCYCRR